MRSRVSAFCLGREVAGPCEFCRLAHVTAGARPRKMVTAKWPSLIDFCCFRHRMTVRRRPLTDRSRKLRKSIKGWKANGCAMSASTSSTLLTRPALSDCVFRKKSGRETAEIREANLPAPSPPPAKPPLCLKSEREVRQESKDRETSEVFALAFARGAVIIFNTL